MDWIFISNFKDLKVESYYNAYYNAYYNSYYNAENDGIVKKAK